MKHKVFFSSLVFVLLFSLLITGCAQPTPAPAPKPSPTPAPAPKPAPIILKFSDQNPEVGWEGQNAAIPWLKQIEQATNGAVKTEAYFNQTLAKGPDTWEAIKANTGDIGWCFHGYWPNMTSLADVIALPFLPVPSGEVGGAVLWQLYQKYPSMQKQFADNKVVLVWTTSPYYLLTVNKQIKTMDDVKGMKIRTVGGPPTEMMKALGAVPVAMAMPDVYLNLDKGVIDGILETWESIYSFKHYEIAKYYTLIPFHVTYFSIAFNTQKWNSLGSDIQNQIMSVSGEKGSRFWGKNQFDTAAVAVSNIIKDKKYQWIEYTPPPDEAAKFSQVGGQPLWDAWVKTNEDKGFKEAREILNTTIQLLKGTK